MYHSLVIVPELQQTLRSLDIPQTHRAIRGRGEGIGAVLSEYGAVDIGSVTSIQCNVTTTQTSYVECN